MEIKKYHVYTDYRDEFVNTWPQAKSQVAAWKREGETNLRVQQLFIDPVTKQDRNGDVLVSIGQYPL